MNSSVAFLVAALFVAAASNVLASDTEPPGGTPSATSCNPTAAPEQPFVPPSPYPGTPPQSAFWHGHEKLWTMLGTNGSWRSLPRNAQGFRQKVFWWSPGFDGRVEPQPNLVVTGRQLDGPGSFVNSGPATNAHHVDFGGWTILSGIDVPNAGCWELTGHYRDQALTFVVWVSGEQPD